MIRVALQTILAQKAGSRNGINSVTCTLDETIITLAPNTQITIEDADARRIAVKMRVLVPQNTHLRYLMQCTDQKLPEQTTELVFHLVGQGAQADVTFLFYATQMAAYRLKTVQQHDAPHTKSNLVVKGVITDQARLLCDNLIRIEKTGQGSNAAQVNKNLLLSTHARVVTIPKLEVFADDVSAAHGAAISRISDSDLFYCQSRGIDKKEAHDFLIQSFLTV